MIQGKDILLLRTLRGSVTYGSHITREEAEQLGVRPSDQDTFSVFAMPLTRLFSLRRLPETEVQEGEGQDEQRHELRHFLRLCLKANPNVLEPLAVEEEHILAITPAGRRLRESLPLFFGRKTVGKAFGGYIRQQLHRYVLHVPNPEGNRRELHRTFGYDTKAASHCIRLLCMGIEILTEGVLRVRRPEARLLKDVRLGRVSKSEALAVLDDLQEKFAQAQAKSPLPDAPDFEAANQLYRELCGMIYGEGIARALGRDPHASG